MTTAIFQYLNNEWLAPPDHTVCEESAVQLVLCFASKEILAGAGIYNAVKKKFPNAQIALSSMAGEILNQMVQDNSLVAAAVTFKATAIATASVNIKDFNSSYDAAMAMVDKLTQQELCYILVLSDGSTKNGSELVKGLNRAVNNRVMITGRLAGDGGSFSETLVGLIEQPAQGNIVAIGFYGQQLTVTHGSQGGWQTFGLEKEVTSSAGNKLFELDSKNALEIYKKYLGPNTGNLPCSAWMFPLCVIIPGSTQPVVRTILSINNDEQSMTFAGEIPPGSKVRFMKANFDMLTSAAAEAAQNTMPDKNKSPDFSLLISCVGRKIILGLRTEEEVEAVQESLGNKTPVAGFYSYGEIAPFNEGGNCRLHNQTMTITSFYELS